MKRATLWVLLVLGIALVLAGSPAYASSANANSSSTTYNTTTLAGKMASIEGTAGLQIRASAFLQDEASGADVQANPGPATPITPSFVLSSPLDGSSITAPAVTVNHDQNGAPQNEPAIAIDPNDANRIVAGMNDYITRTWSCMIGSTPCSALGDGYSGTYFSNDGGQTWCCVATDPQHLGTLIPGVEHLTGGIYDAGGDPSLAFNTQGTVYYAGLGFDRTAAPDSVEVSTGRFDSSGMLSWSAPTFINAVNSPSILNDKEWITVDAHVGSPFQDRVYVSWTRFIFNPINGRYVSSAIDFVYSSDGGKTFSSPQLVVGNVLYDQGSRVVVGPDGTLYVFWLGSTRLATFDSVYMVKSTDGGLTFSAPVAVATVSNVIPPFHTVFRVNSYPAVAAAPDGTLYATWSAEVPNDGSSFAGTVPCTYFLAGTANVYANCHSTTLWSQSTDGGMTWSSPMPIFAALEGTFQTPDGYPVTQPSGSILNAPAPHMVESVFPAVKVAPNGNVYMSAYVADIVSPWQTCAEPGPGASGRVNCLALGSFVNNARLELMVTDLTSGVTQTMNTHPINSRHNFGGGFFGDYNDIAVDSNSQFRAVWTDSNNVQTVVWWWGFDFVPTSFNQQDIAMGSGSF